MDRVIDVIGIVGAVMAFAAAAWAMVDDEDDDG